MISQFLLPAKIHSYLRRLVGQYKLEDKKQLVEIISSSKIYVVEETTYDNWNGGTYGHDVKLFLPQALLCTIRVKEQNKIADEILEDIRLCASSFSNEFFSAVFFEIEDDNDPKYLKATPFTSNFIPNPEALTIWKAGHLRLFISHRDKDKAAAYELASYLDAFGISSFVAHDSIEPMTTWQSEILKGLNSMEIMLAFITDDFHESIWTNQEVGYALGRGIPIVSLKLQRKDPSGFIGNVQAIKGTLDNVTDSVLDLYNVLAEKLGNQSRLQTALITAFLEINTFTVVQERFKRLSDSVKNLTHDEVKRFIQCFHDNDQLHKAIYLNNHHQRLKRFLERSTGKSFQIEGKVIKEIQNSDLEIPF